LPLTWEILIFEPFDPATTIALKLLKSDKLFCAEEPVLSLASFRILMEKEKFEQSNNKTRSEFTRFQNTPVDLVFKSLSQGVARGWLQVAFVSFLDHLTGITTTITATSTNNAFHTTPISCCK